MKDSPDTITIDQEVYVKQSKAMAAKSEEGLEYVIVRTYSAGVHAGYLKQQNGKHVVLLDSRRIWYWQGAASLSQLAVDGTTEPTKCKFPCPVAKITLTEAIEIIPTTEKAKQSIMGVPIWEK